MSDAWVVVTLVGGATVLLKAAGPVFLGGRALPARIQPAVDLLAPVMLAALVTTQTFGRNEEITVDARVPGVAGAVLVVALWRNAPIVAAMVVAAAITAAVRGL